MAAEIFKSLANLRMIQNTETDADSPDTEMLKSAFRYAIECILLLAVGTGVSGTASANPSDDTNGYFYDTSKTWTTDQHAGRTLVITSGLAKGNTYTIDATPGSYYLACTGDNLYADGVRIYDGYVILYDSKNHHGHNHDAINSAQPVIQDAAITTVMLKSIGTNVSGTNPGTVDIATQDFSFMPNIYQENTGEIPYLYGRTINTADHVGRFVLGGGAAISGYVVRFRYISASDEPFIYMVREKATGKILHCWMGDDPPPGYWGLSETPEDFERPVVGKMPDGRPEFDPEKHEEIISWKVKKDLWLAIKDRQKADKKKAPHKILETEFEYDRESCLWKSKNLIAA